MIKRFIIAAACAVLAIVPSPLWAYEIGDILVSATTLPVNQTVVVTGYALSPVECTNGSGGAYGALERSLSMDYWDPSMVTFEYVGTEEWPGVWDDEGQPAMLNKYLFTAEFISATTSTWDILVINCGETQMVSGMSEFSWTEE